MSYCAFSNWTSLLYSGNSKQHLGHFISFPALVSLAKLVVLAFDCYPHVYVGKFQVVHVQVVNGMHGFCFSLQSYS